jgi:hypothetical protein
VVGTEAEAGLGDMDEPACASAPAPECLCEFGPAGLVEHVGPASVDGADAEAQTESAMESQDDKRAVLVVSFR